MSLRRAVSLIFAEISAGKTHYNISDAAFFHVPEPLFYTSPRAESTLKGRLEKLDFSFKVEAWKKFYRRHIRDIPRIKFFPQRDKQRLREVGRKSNFSRWP